RPILYKSSKEFLMRFGLSDLDELPSLKEFEALAREALGTDEGIAPATDESLLAAPEDQPAELHPEPAPPQNCHPERSEGSASSSAAPDAGAATELSGSSPTSRGSLVTDHASSEALREKEVTATNEGMPSGPLDEDPQPPSPQSASASK